MGLHHEEVAPPRVPGPPAAEVGLEQPPVPPHVQLTVAVLAEGRVRRQEVGVVVWGEAVDGSGRECPQASLDRLVTPPRVRNSHPGQCNPSRRYPWAAQHDPAETLDKRT